MPPAQLPPPPQPMQHVQPVQALQTVDWRRRVFAAYAQVRADTDPERAHRWWCATRDELFASHPASPLLPQDRRGFTGLRVAAYDPAWRFEVELRAPSVDEAGERLQVDTGTDGTVPFQRLGDVELPGVGTLAVWRLASYGGGLFVPAKDGLAGRPGGTYGGGRYVLDTVKGADLGGGEQALVVDLNFAYNPSCAYDPAWACPLAQPANTITVDVPVGELAFR